MRTSLIKHLNQFLASSTFYRVHFQVIVLKPCPLFQLILSLKNLQKDINPNYRTFWKNRQIITLAFYKNI